MAAGRQARPEEVSDVLYLSLPEVRSMQVMNPEEVEKMGIGVEGRLLVKSVEQMAHSFEVLGRNIEAKAQEIANKEGREYKNGAISLGVTEIGVNAVKNGMKYSGEPVFIGWKLGPEVCEFTVIDSGREDFDPLRYARMTVEQMLAVPDIGAAQGHSGIIMLYGSIAPGEESGGLLRKEDIQWIAVRNERGERIGTKVEFKVRSTEKPRG
jgi:hypothetical protein